MQTFADQAIEFNQHLNLKLQLPSGIKVLNPFTESTAREISSSFYRNFYSDTKQRRLILGINPGRFGAGVTGIPFTDTKRLNKVTNLNFNNLKTHEVSSVFVYKMIEAYGGEKKFYGNFYINSVFPLALVKLSSTGKEVNFNYYDSKEVSEALTPQIKKFLKKYSQMNISHKTCFCLGNNKNYKFLTKINKELKLFQKIIALEHPRYIVQYRNKNMQDYIEKYHRAFLEN